MSLKFQAIVAVGFFLAVGLSGCESVQRKFTRKPKKPAPAPSPIIAFQDYDRAMTPLERYRKHYLMFDYWNDDLKRGLEAVTLNPKGLKRASKEALAELTALKDLLREDIAVEFEPLINERAAVDRRVQGGSVTPSQTHTILRALEAQTREVHRHFFWRDVEDKLKE